MCKYMNPECEQEVLAIKLKFIAELVIDGSISLESAINIVEQIGMTSTDLSDKINLLENEHE